MCVCVGVNVPDHIIKCTSYQGSQSKRFEKCCSGRIEFIASLLYSVRAVPSPFPPALSPPPLHSSHLHPPKSYSPIHTVLAGFCVKKTPEIRMFIWEVIPKSTSKEMEKWNRKGTKLFTPHFEKQRHVWTLCRCWESELEWKPENWFWSSFCHQIAVWPEAAHLHSWPLLFFC